MFGHWSITDTIFLFFSFFAHSFCHDLHTLSWQVMEEAAMLEVQREMTTMVIASISRYVL